MEVSAMLYKCTFCDLTLNGRYIDKVFLTRSSKACVHYFNDTTYSLTISTFTLHNHNNYSLSVACISAKADDS